MSPEKPSGFWSWARTMPGAMILTGALVLFAVGVFRVSDFTKQESQAQAPLTREEISKLFKEQLDPIKDEQKSQNEKVQALALEVANMKGRMQLAGLNSGLSQMGAGRRN